MRIEQKKFTLDLYERIAALGLSEEAAKAVIDIVFWAMGKSVELSKNEAKKGNGGSG